MPARAQRPSHRTDVEVDLQIRTPDVGRGSGCKQESRLGCGHLDLIPARKLPGREHRSLQLWAVRTEDRHLHPCDGLDDEVNVNRTSSGVRPQAVVNLIGDDESTGNGRGLSEQRTEFSRLVVAKISYRGDMALRFHNQCPNAEGSDAVLDKPEVGPMDETTR